MPFFNGNTVIHWDNKSTKNEDAHTRPDREVFILFHFKWNVDIWWHFMAYNFLGIWREKKNEPIMFSLFSFNNLFSDEKLLAMSKWDKMWYLKSTKIVIKTVLEWDIKDTVLVKYRFSIVYKTFQRKYWIGDSSGGRVLWKSISEIRANVPIKAQLCASSFI